METDPLLEADPHWRKNPWKTPGGRPPSEADPPVNRQAFLKTLPSIAAGNKLLLQNCYYRPPTNFREGNVFSHVCVSVILSTEGSPLQGPAPYRAHPLCTELCPLTCSNLFNLDLTLQRPRPLPTPDNFKFFIVKHVWLASG